MTSVLFGGLLVLLALSVPIAVTLGLASAAALHTAGTPLVMMAQSVYEALDSFGLMAIPFFVLAGTLMQSGGIAQRLVDLANALVGWIQGGLGACVVLTSMFFATMSGSSSATTAAIGSVLIPAMEKKGYPRSLAGAIAASSGELGVIIPPSIPMIVYALSANVSVADLFLAGVLPGLFIGGSLIATVYVVARLKGYDAVGHISVGQWLANLLLALKRASLAILMPVLILGGIYGGLFTATEASVVAVVYGLVIGIYVYEELRWKDVLPLLGRSAVTSSIILMIVGFAAIFAYMLTVNQVPHKVGEFVSGISRNPIVFLLVVNVLLFVTGMFMETLAAIIILAPILAPAAAQYGIDPVHFGTVMIVNLAIGMVTPPVGVNLFVVCQVARLKLEQLVRPLLVFLSVLIVDVLVISYVPALTTWFK
jgi:C4-dicarboxylate transporter, DctM subunit